MRGIAADLARKLGLLTFPFFLMCSAPLFGCQESCVIISTASKEATLMDAEGKILDNADLVIRDASKDAKGPDRYCSRFGPVIKRQRTNANGRVSLSDLSAGEYWLTYMDPKDGESFRISIRSGKRSRIPLELQLDRLGGRCYLVDVERNATKPPTGWPKPRPEANAQTN